MADNNCNDAHELDNTSRSAAADARCVAATSRDGKRASLGKRQQLTFAEKNQLRQHHATISGGGGAPKQSDMVDWVWTAFGKKVGRSSIGRILSSAVDVEEAAMGPQRMRKRFSKYPDVEAALLTFVLEQQGNPALLTDDTLWDRARTAAGSRSVSMSWIQRFKRRNGVLVKRRSLLTAGDDGDNSAEREAFVAALTKNRDELLRFIHVRASTDTDTTPHNAPAKDALVEETDEDDDDEEEEAVVAAAAAAQEARDNVLSDHHNERETETEHSYEPDESDADASVPLQHASSIGNNAQRERAASDAVAMTPEAALPPRRSRDAAQAGATTRAVTRARVSASPRFAIVSQTTGRVELENRSSSSTSEQPVSRESSPLRPSRASADAAPSVQSSSSFMMPARSTVAAPPTVSTALVETPQSLDQSPKVPATATSFTSPRARSSASRRTSLGGSSSVGGSAFDEQLEEERKRKVELEEREIELRVEGLRCDNLLKRIKVAEENMLARKRLRDAGVTEDEINEMLPVVKIHQL